MTPEQEFERLKLSLALERASGMPRWHLTPRPLAVQFPPAGLAEIDELVHAVTGHRTKIPQLRKVA